jgi:hypothetical protein
VAVANRHWRCLPMPAFRPSRARVKTRMASPDCRRPRIARIAGRIAAGENPYGVAGLPIAGTGENAYGVPGLPRPRIARIAGWCSSGWG